MQSFTLEAIDISKYFIRNSYIFKNINLKITNGEIIGLLGDNGSGKSTLLKILAGVLSYSSGKIIFNVNSKEIKSENINQYVSFVAPYLNLYEEFTPFEHYKIIAKIRGIRFDEEKLDYWLNFFKLKNYKHSQIKGFSSGMKQRFKYILATQIDSLIMFLDEPTSNLDEDGISKVNQIITEQVNKNNAVVIATNEERERILCHKTFNLMNFK